MDQHDRQTILQFIRLFTPLELEEERLQVYVGYLNIVILMRSTLEFEQLVELIPLFIQFMNYKRSVILENIFKICLLETMHY